MTADVLKLLAVVFLVLLNGFFVAAEFALVSARPNLIAQLANEGSRAARAAQKAMNQPTRFISGCQVGITVASLSLGWITEPAIAHRFEPLLDNVLEDNAWLGAHVVGAALAILLVTSLHIVIGEQVPKMIAVQRSERTILATAPVVRWVSQPIRPFVAALYGLTDLVLNALGLSRQAEHSLVYTEDELRLLVSASRMEGYLDPGEQEMIERIFKFAEVESDEIMVPRTEMKALPASASFAEAIALVASTGHSRFPVYGDDLDDLVGVFHAKDLLRHSGNDASFNIRKFVRPVLFVSERTPLDELLATMKAKRSHIAIVVDEYGGTAGLVTLEDVLERIVGEVQDRADPVSADAEELENGVVRVSGLLPIGDINDRFGTHIDDDYYNSLGGFVFGQLGRKPEIGDEVRANGHSFRVVELDGLRIARIEIVETSAFDPALDPEPEPVITATTEST